MRKRLFGFVVVCSALVLSGCATSRAQLAQAQSCADWRWIAIKSGPAEDPCPPPTGSGWKSEELFFPPPPLPKEPCGEEGPRDLSYQQYSPAQQPSPATTEALKELQRFCVYKTEDDGKPRRPPFESAAAAGLKRLDRDCAVISTSAPDPQLTRMSEHLLSQAGMPATPMAISRQRGVRL